MNTNLTFAEFYPYYCREHSNRTCRRLHFIGTSFVPVLVLAALLSWRWEFLVLAPIQGYLLAWIGHFFFEHNKPLTLEHPWLSLRADWTMWWQMLMGTMKR